MQTQTPKAIRKAVIPAAGLGTRFMPVTKSVNKALLPIFDKPAIHFIVEEAARAGLREIAIIHSPNSQSVIDYFSVNHEIMAELQSKGKRELTRRLTQISAMANITGICQARPLGLGHAISLARDWVGDEPFVALLPDDLIWHEPSATRQMLNAYEICGGQVVGGIRVARESIPDKGIIDIGDSVAGAPNLLKVKGVVEKPSVDAAPSDISIFGRYIFQPDIFAALDAAAPGAIGEIQITDAIQATIPAVPLHAALIEGVHTDTGSPAGMFEAILEYAKTDQNFLNIVRAKFNLN